MAWILSDILSLIQYINISPIEYSEERLQVRCDFCGKLKLWLHGKYPRAADRINSSKDSLNPIWIQRYYCPTCRKTTSVLPECIPPRRWYLWETQQEVILLFLLGNSARSIEKQAKPSRHTIRRWIAWLTVQFKVHKDVLCNHFPSFGLFLEPVSFWKHVFDKLALSTAMRICHVAGVSIP